MRASSVRSQDVHLYLDATEEADAPHALAAAPAIWQRFNVAHPDADITYLHH